MRSIVRIIVHCTAGSQKAKASDVVRYHTGSKSKGCLGWSKPGYHYVIEADGTVVSTLSEAIPSNGVKGYNSTSINVCYCGGVDLSRPGNPPVDNRTDAQKASLLTLLRSLRKRYPGARIYGHRDFAVKACPSFDAKTEYKDI